MKTAVPLLFLLSCGLLLGCDELLFVTIPGSGVLLVEQREVDEFTAMRVSGALTVDFTAGQPRSVEVQGDDNLVPLVVTEVSNGVLHIHMEAKGGVRPVKPMKVTVTAPDLTKVIASGAVEISVRDVDTTEFAITVRGASEVRVSGKTQQLDLDVAGASEIAAEKLVADEVKVDVSGASEAQVCANHKISGKVSGASEVRYSGSAQQVDIRKTGASDVKRADASSPAESDA
jgi:hypothetical protein